MKKESKALTSRQEILDYLWIDKNKFYRLIADGLPAIKRGGSWTANKDQLDEYFKVDNSSKDAE